MANRESRHGLSCRGERLLENPPFAEYLREHFARVVTPYDARSNPDGYIPLCIAENKLVWEFLKQKTRQGQATPHSALCYDSMIGAEAFRAQLARFMGRTFLGRAITWEQVVVLAGAGSVLEMLFYSIADPGDGVLVPTPSYAGFWMDLETRNQLRILPVHCTSEHEFRLTTELLDRAFTAADRPVRALLFTTPNNPLGTVYSADEIRDVLDWAEQRRIHVIFDEIYALSVFGERPFTSCASLVPNLGERIHIVWAFSKDFGASGLRCGVLVSSNQSLIRTIDGLAYWACCSGHTQHLLGTMISDDAWVDHYIFGMQRLLREAYGAVTDALAEAGIPFLEAEAGFFLLCDMREFMDSITWPAENDLWQRVLAQANVNLTPGSACHNGEPGFMRLCYAGLDPQVVAEGVRRIGRAVRGAR